MALSQLLSSIDRDEPAESVEHDAGLIGIDVPGGEYDTPRPYIECGRVDVWGAKCTVLLCIGITGYPSLVVRARDGRLSHLSRVVVPVKYQRFTLIF